MRYGWGNSLHTGSVTCGGTPTPALPRKRERERTSACGSSGLSDSIVKQPWAARPHSRGADSARAWHRWPPSRTRGRRESRVRAAPAVSCAKWKKTHTSIQVQRRQSGFPCAVVYGLYRALPGDRAFLPPSPLRSLLLKNLTPASGRQDHTTSPSATTALVSRRHRVHRIPPRVRDDRDPPLSSGETREAMPLICPTR